MMRRCDPAGQQQETRDRDETDLRSVHGYASSFLQRISE
jgi:hypothetical protein